jgi:hypothetical protein
MDRQTTRIGGGNAPPLHPERVELAQVKLYDTLRYYYVGMGTPGSQLLGAVLAVLLGPNPGANPGNVTLLRNSLRPEIIEEFVKLKLKYP